MVSPCGCSSGISGHERFASPMPADVNDQRLGARAKRVMLYGATGYTGRLIAQRACEAGLAPVLAGRDPERVRSQAERLGLAWRAFGLDAPDAVAEALGDIDVVIHAAGPFIRTARPMLEGCLRAGAHYLDIGGELPAFQDALSLHRQAIERGVMIMPGAAWSVVASDCLAAHVAALLPSAKYLRLGIARSPLSSRGTARSTLNLVSSDVTIRRNGRLTSVPIGRLERAFDYGQGERWSIALSWPDVLTAYHTTGIANVEVYVDTGTWRRIFAPVSAPIGEALRLPMFQTLRERFVNALPEGPTDESRRVVRHVIVAEAEDNWRRCRRVRLTTADGYCFTADAAVAIAHRVIRGEFEIGFQTPARVYGADFVLGLEGAIREDLGGERSIGGEVRSALG